MSNKIATIALMAQRYEEAGTFATMQRTIEAAKAIYEEVEAACGSEVEGEEVRLYAELHKVWARFVEYCKDNYTHVVLKADVGLPAEEGEVFEAHLAHSIHFELPNDIELYFDRHGNFHCNKMTFGAVQPETWRLFGEVVNAFMGGFYNDLA